MAPKPKKPKPTQPSKDPAQGGGWERVNALKNAAKFLRTSKMQAELRAKKPQQPQDQPSGAWFSGEAQEPLTAPVDVVADQEPPSEHSWLYSMMRKHSHRLRAKVFSGVIATLILANVVVFVVSTTRDRNGDSGWVYMFEAVSSCVFAVEYILRMALLGESKQWRRYGAVMSRLRYAITLESLIDLVSFMPFFIELIAG